jgi:hypothetical protein
MSSTTKQKIMLSQPMSGLTDAQILQLKSNFLRFAEKENLEVVHSYFKDDFANEVCNENIVNTPVHYLARSIECMSQCHFVYFAQGWQNARGCKIEHEIALKYGLGIIYFREITD